MKKYLLILLMFSFRPLYAQNLYTMPQGSQSHVSSMENLNGVKGNGGKSNAGAKGSAFTNVKPGKTQTLLNIKAAGIVQRIWCTISEYNDPVVLRALRIRMYWDGSKLPAVDVPFGDFFCAGTGKPTAFQSALFSNPEGRSFNCYIPMPFKSGARIELVNNSDKDFDLFFDVDYITTAKPQTNLLYFHSVWSRQQNPVGQDVTLLPEVKGKGRFLGVSVGINVNPVYGKSWWGEGEVKMYIDGDGKYPSINGTGSEDYIGSGWGEGVFANQYQGCLVANDTTRQYAFYRFHIPDAIYFYKDFKATIQQIGGYFGPVVREMQAKGVPLQPVTISGDPFTRLLEPGTDKAAAIAGATGQQWMNFYRTDDYAVTAYYYLDRP